MADQERGFLYAAAKKDGKNTSKIGEVRDLKRLRERNAELGRHDNATIQKWVETPNNKQWERAIKHLFDDKPERTDKGEPLEWFTVEKEHLFVIVELISAEIWQAQALALERIQKSDNLEDTQAEIDRELKQKQADVEELLGKLDTIKRKRKSDAARAQKELSALGTRTAISLPETGTDESPVSPREPPTAGEAVVLERLQNGETQAAIARALHVTAVTHFVRRLRDKGYSWPGEPGYSSPLRSPSPHGARGPRSEDVLPDKTPQAEFLTIIVDVLEDFGGSGRAKDVIAQVGERVQLRAGDLETNESGRLVWKTTVRFARLQLKKDGILKSSSTKGLWELA